MSKLCVILQHIQILAGGVRVDTLVFGTVGNLLCIVTLCSKTFRSTSTGFILSIMVILDLGQLLLCFMPFWLSRIFDINLENTHFVVCPVRRFFIYILRHQSAFMICLLTFERFIAVYFPLRCKELCSPVKLKTVCFASMILYFLTNSHFLVIYHLVVVTEITESMTICDWEGLQYGFVEHYVWPWIDACFTAFIPSAILFVVNALIVRKITASRRDIRKSQNASNSSTPNSKLASATIILFIESFLYLLLMGPVVIFIILVALQNVRLNDCDFNL